MCSFNHVLLNIEGKAKSTNTVTQAQTFEGVPGQFSRYFYILPEETCGETYVKFVIFVHSNTGDPDSEGGDFFGKNSPNAFRGL
jgi:hypothetical protein